LELVRQCIAAPLDNGKFVRTAVPQLVADYLSQFRDQLVIDSETYFNGAKKHHDNIAKAIADILDKSIMKTGYELKMLEAYDCYEE